MVLAQRVKDIGANLTVEGLEKTFLMTDLSCS